VRCSLAELTIDHNVGVSDRGTYAVERIDSDYVCRAE
jgi:restriction endonuclease Mrr